MFTIARNVIDYGNMIGEGIFMELKRLSMFLNQIVLNLGKGKKYVKDANRRN